MMKYVYSLTFFYIDNEKTNTTTFIDGFHKCDV